MFDYYRSESESYEKVFILNNKIVKGLIKKNLLKMSDLKNYRMPLSMEDIIPNIEKMSGSAKLLTDVIAETLKIESFLKVDKNEVNFETLIGEDFIVVNKVYYTINPLSSYIETLKENLLSYNKNEVLFDKIGYISTIDFKNIKEDLNKNERHLEHITMSKIRIENLLNVSLNKAADKKSDMVQLFYRSGELRALYIMGNQIFEESIEKLSIQTYNQVADYIVDFFGDQATIIKEFKGSKYKLKLSKGSATEAVSNVPVLLVKISNLNSKVVDLFERFNLERRDQRALEKALTTPFGLFAISSKTNKKEVMYSLAQKEKEIDSNSRMFFLEKEVSKDFADITQNDTLQSLEDWKQLDYSSYSVVVFEEIETKEELEFVLSLTSKGKKVIIGVNSNNAVDTFASLYNKISNKALLVDNLLGILQVEQINKVCPSCSKTTPLFQDRYFQEFSGLENIPKMSQKIRVENEKGCDACYKGYKGFVEVAEYLHNDNILKSALIEGFNIQNLKIEKNSDSWFNIYENSLDLLGEEKITTHSIIQALGYPRKL